MLPLEEYFPSPDPDTGELNFRRSFLIKEPFPPTYSSCEICGRDIVELRHKGLVLVGCATENEPQAPCTKCGVEQGLSSVVPITLLYQEDDEVHMETFTPEHIGGWLGEYIHTIDGM